MDLFEKLRAVALQGNLTGEFPSWLLAEVLVIADQPSLYADKVHLVEILTDQISNFDTYAGAGCFDTSVGADAVSKTIRLLVTSSGCSAVAEDAKTCEIVNCCQFFRDNMKELPKAAAYIKDRLCYSDYASCSRFKIYKEFGGASIPPYLDPSDTEEVEKVMQCLRKKQDCPG